MLEIMHGLPDDVLGVSAVGSVSDSDYRDILIPAAEDKLTRHERLKVLYHIGARFEKFQPRALMDDAAFGLRHRSRVAAIAIVTNVAWCRAAARMMSHFVPGEVREFDEEGLAAAREWISRPDAVHTT